MIFTTSKGHVIDTESQAYKDYLRGKQLDAERGDYPEPAPYRTLGDVIELERRRREREARESDDSEAVRKPHETVPA